MVQFVQTQDTTTDLPEWLQEPIDAFIGALPEIAAAIVVLLIGWIAGMLIGRSVRSLVDRTGLDRRVMNTPLGKSMGGTEGSVAKTLGKIAAWFIYAIAILAAASLLDIAILSEWISTAITYIPAFIAGLLVILLGFILADFVGDVIGHTEMATRTRYTQLFADGVRIFLYFIVLTVGLDTMGVDVTLLYIFARAAAWGIAIGTALALGIGFGWGLKDYVSQNINRWVGRAQQETRE